MTDDDTMDLLAGEYVLGTLLGAERERFEAQLRTDSQAMRAVAAWEERLLPLSEPAEPVEPPNGVWKSIRQRIATEPKRRGLVTIHAGEGEWLPHAPGIAIKLLHGHPGAGRQSFLLRFDPGAELEAHDHMADEECMMLSGEITFGDITVRAGDYHLAPKGIAHAKAYSPEGAIVFVRGMI